jgi:L-rhamnose isomerase
MPKTEREKLIADKEEMTTNKSDYVIELRTLSDVIKTAYQRNLSPILESYRTQQENVNKSYYVQVFICNCYHSYFFMNISLPDYLS